VLVNLVTKTILSGKITGKLDEEELKTAYIYHNQFKAL
jgi:hypothetical protein